MNRWVFYGFFLKGNRTPKACGFAKQIHKEANKVHQGYTLRAEVRFPQGFGLQTQYILFENIKPLEGGLHHSINGL
jgi:hypothetical protein